MPTTTRRTVLPAVILAAVLAVSACGGEAQGSDSQPASTVTTQPALPLPTGDAPITPPAPAITAVDFGAPGEITRPGTPLLKGEPAWLSQSATDPEVTDTVGISVLDVRPLDAAMFESFSNPETFAGYTPYAITFQQQWLGDTPEGIDPVVLDLFPIKQDGSTGEYLTNQFAFGASENACGLALPAYDAATKTLVTCFVGLSKDSPIVAARFNGETHSATVANPANDYFNSPLTWN